MGTSRNFLGTVKADKITVVEFITINPTAHASAPSASEGRIFVDDSDDKLRSCENGSTYETVSST